MKPTTIILSLVSAALAGVAIVCVVSENEARAELAKVQEETREQVRAARDKTTASERTAAAAAQEQNRELFQRLDVDKSGLITPAEFAALIPAPRFIDVSAEMIRFDSNRDQIITLVEYRTTTLANFDRLDLDKDGILTAAELPKKEKPATNEPSTR